jgi:hypothetical protein
MMKNTASQAMECHTCILQGFCGGLGPGNDENRSITGSRIEVYYVHIGSGMTVYYVLYS